MVWVGGVPPSHPPYYAPSPLVPPGGHRRPLAAVLAAPTVLTDILTAVFPGGRFEVAAAAAALVAAAAAVVVAAEVITAVVDVTVAAFVARRRRRAEALAAAAAAAVGGSRPGGLATGWLPVGGGAAGGRACGWTSHSAVNGMDDGCCGSGKVAANTGAAPALGEGAEDVSGWDGYRAVDRCGTPTKAGASAEVPPAGCGDGHGHSIAAAEPVNEEVEDEAEDDGTVYIDRDDFGRDGWVAAALPAGVVPVVMLSSRPALSV